MHATIAIKRKACWLRKTLNKYLIYNLGSKMSFCVFDKMSKSLENNTSYNQNSFWNISTWENLKNRKTMREKEEEEDKE